MSSTENWNEGDGVGDRLVGEKIRGEGGGEKDLKKDDDVFYLAWVMKLFPKSALPILRFGEGICFDGVRISDYWEDGESTDLVYIESSY